MKKLNTVYVMQKANAIYGMIKCKKAGMDPAYMAPEQFPTMQSDSIKAVVEALVDCINEASENKK